MSAKVGLDILKKGGLKMKPVKIGVQKSDRQTNYYIMSELEKNGGHLFYIQLHSKSEELILGLTAAEHHREVCERIMFCTLAAVGYDPIFVQLSG